MFVLEAIQAWLDPNRRSPKTLRHQGYGKFVLDGETIYLNSAMR